jgi:hypothetical protein
MKRIIFLLYIVVFAGYFFSSSAFAMVYEQPQGIVLELEYPFKSASLNLVDVNFRYIYENLPPEQGTYEAQITNEKGIELARRKIILDNGKNEIIIPYFPEATKVTFTNMNGELLSGINTETISVCNSNGVCQMDKGETADSCPSDCKEGMVQTEVSSETDWIKISIYILAVFALVILGIIIYLAVKIKR